MKEKKKKVVSSPKKINFIGRLENPRWYKLRCVCSQNPNRIEDIYPIKDCKFCKFTAKEKSVPFDKEPYERFNYKTEKTVLVTEIRLHRGEKYQEIIAYEEVLG
jgi:hypothetical protein